MNPVLGTVMGMSKFGCTFEAVNRNPKGDHCHNLKNTKQPLEGMRGLGNMIAIITPEP